MESYERALTHIVNVSEDCKNFAIGLNRNVDFKKRPEYKNTLLAIVFALNISDPKNLKSILEGQLKYLDDAVYGNSPNESAIDSPEPLKAHNEGKHKYRCMLDMINFQYHL